MILQDRYRDEATQHKKLFEKITKRGPMAFLTLLDICQHNFPIAYELLKNGGGSSLYQRNPEYKSLYRPNRVRSVSAGDYINYVNSAEIVRQRLGNLSIGSQSLAEEDDTKNNNDTVDETGETGGEKRLLQEFREPVRSQYQVELAVRRQNHRILEAYEMRKRNRGVVFIVNVITYINETHPTRNGAEADKDNLVSLFQQLGFTVFYYEDLTSDVSMNSRNNACLLNVGALILSRIFSWRFLHGFLRGFLLRYLYDISWDFTLYVISSQVTFFFIEVDWKRFFKPLA